MADDDLPDAPWATQGGKEELPDAPWTTPTQHGALASAGEGALSGVSAGFSDEYRGLRAASGLPETAPDYVVGPLRYAYEGIKAPVGAARRAYEYLTGEEGTATKEYNRKVEEVRKRQAEMKEQHPYIYGGSEIAGALGSLAAAPELGIAKGAGLLGRAGEAAISGGVYGGLAGAGEGESLGERAKLGAVGAGAGALSGPIGAGLGEVAGRVAQPIYEKTIGPAVQALRGLGNTEGEAAARILQRQAQGVEQLEGGKATMGLTPSQFEKAREAGQPAMLMDIGGVPTLSLMRTAANVSPEARQTIESALEGRFTSQGDRVSSALRDLIMPDVNASKTRASLEAVYNAERGPAYQAAYQAGDREIWSPTLERLSSSPTVTDALKGALNKWRDYAVIDGYGAMNPPVEIANGLINFTGGKLPVYPNLQLWDYASRTLKGEAQQAFRAGNMSEYNRYSSLEKMVKSELDKQVPEFANARGVASQYFGGVNAIEAGGNALKEKDIGKIGKAMAGMSPAEKEMFQEGALDKIVTNVQGKNDKVSAVRGLMDSPADRERMNKIFGPEAADKIQAYLHTENVFDFARRQGLGNSSTVRQLVEAGLMGAAGGGLGEYLGGGQGGLEGFVTGAGLRMAPKLAGEGVKRLISVADQKVAKEIANLLTSSDPGALQAGMEKLAKNKQMSANMQGLQRRLAPLGAVQAVPAAEEKIQNAGFAGGGAVKQSHEEAGYHRGFGPYDPRIKAKRHCSICKYFLSSGPHCQIVVDPIRPGDGCSRFKPKK